MPTIHTVSNEKIEIPVGFAVLPPTEIIKEDDFVYSLSNKTFVLASYSPDIIGKKVVITICTIRKIATTNTTPPPLPTDIKNNDAKICANCEFYNQGAENTTLKDYKFHNCYFHAKHAKNIITGEITMDNVFPCSNMREEGNCGLEAKYYKEKTEYDQNPFPTIHTNT